MQIPKTNADIVIPGIYKHYKGNHYLTLGLATHTETGETMVVYRALYDELHVWCRPVKMWDEIVDGAGTKRFQLVKPESVY